eukprot:363417-Chlamydomonas_euryale.AAC.10
MIAWIDGWMDEWKDERLDVCMDARTWPCNHPHVLPSELPPHQPASMAASHLLGSAIMRSAISVAPSVLYLRCRHSRMMSGTTAAMPAAAPAGRSQPSACHPASHPWLLARPSSISTTQRMLRISRTVSAAGQPPAMRSRLLGSLVSAATADSNVSPDAAMGVPCGCASNLAIRNSVAFWMV